MLSQIDKIELRAKIDNILIMHSSFESAIERVQTCFDGALIGTDPTCLAIIGESRTGKSRVLEHFENKYKQERFKEGLYTPILRMQVHSKPTVKGLSEELLHNIGDPLFDKGTEYSKTRRLKQLMSESGTKMIILDEFQHFIDQGGKKIQHHVADWLKILVDQTKVGLVVAGLPRCLNVINSNDQLARRFMAPQYLKRFDWTVQDEQNEFRRLLYSLQELLDPFDLPDLDGEEMSFRMYIASGGLIGYLVKILREATAIAVYSNELSISLDVLNKAQQRAIFNTNKNVVKPFSKGFSIIPTENNVREAMQLGVCCEPIGKSTAKKVHLGAILSAS